MSEQDRRFKAFETHPQSDMPITAAGVDRDWMDASPNRFAYRCLPLTIANRAGWMIANPSTFTATWNGGPNRDAIAFRFGPPPKVDFTSFQVHTAGAGGGADEPTPAPVDPRIISHFGQGIITFSIPFLFRTPKSINLWIKGPTNRFKDGAHPLEGIVEADWVPSTFTMNWKLTRPRTPVTFWAGEPICMLVPIARGLAEGLDPIRLPMESDAEVHREYKAWETSRADFISDLAKVDSDAVKRGWQKHYFKGETHSGQAADEHQTRLDLREFRRVEAEGRD